MGDLDTAEAFALLDDNNDEEGNGNVEEGMFDLMREDDFDDLDD